MEEKERYELFGEYIIKDNDDNAKCQLLDTYKTYVILNQQDKRIKELEEENEKVKINNYLADYYLVEKENQQLKHQLAITEKSLELACETIKQMCGRPLWIGGNIPSPEPKDSEYFIEQAKEMLENE